MNPSRAELNFWRYFLAISTSSSWYSCTYTPVPSSHLPSFCNDLSGCANTNIHVLCHMHALMLAEDSGRRTDARHRRQQVRVTGVRASGRSNARLTVPPHSWPSGRDQTPRKTVMQRLSTRCSGNANPLDAQLAVTLISRSYGHRFRGLVKKQSEIWDQVSACRCTFDNL